MSKLCFCSLLPSTSAPAKLRPPRRVRFLSCPASPLLSTRLRVVREFIDAETEDKGDTVPISTEITSNKSEENGLLLNTGKIEGNKEKKKKVESVEESEHDQLRFKLQNGKEVLAEKAYIVGVECRSNEEEDLLSIEDSIKELEQLAETAGLSIAGSTYQKLQAPNSKTYIGSGKVADIKSAIHAFGVETVIFDDELSAGQLRNLEKAFGGEVRVCDRTALILDIFNQRAATHEASLQVALAQMEYQLPRLTKLWTHLERQSGGQVKGMGEKQIEIDKRILRTRIGTLKKELESVRQHRKLYRNRRHSVPIPVVALVGYTNAGKSTLLNQLTGADVLAEDKLFATLDPTTRRVELKNGNEFLLTDTVGFIQKLPTMLVAAFRATLEEIEESSLIVHVVDISHPLAQQQIEAVDYVLKDLDVELIPKVIVWNKIDKAEDPERLKREAEAQGIICISAMNGTGLDQFCNAIQDILKDSMVPIEAIVPYDQGELLNNIHQIGMVERTEYKDNGTFVKAHVPLRLARILTPMRHQVATTT